MPLPNRNPAAAEIAGQRSVDDPAFSGLTATLQHYDFYEVLRYRPGKRITIGAIDPEHGAVIVKYIAKGAQSILDCLTAVSSVYQELEFEVSRPISYAPESNHFVQERLAGDPVSVADLASSPTLVQKMAAATASLHRSAAVFDTSFEASSQRLRTERYLGLIESRFPDTGAEIAAIRGTLAELEDHINRRQAALVPVHGSLHSHQWLSYQGRLALVDFDRAAMGHPELDVATFLAEFDYESPAIASAVNPWFVAGIESLDARTLLFYRGHKHLAKAFKASKATDFDTASSKTRRNLNRCTCLLTATGA